MAIAAKVSNVARAFGKATFRRSGRMAAVVGAVTIASLALTLPASASAAPVAKATTAAPVTQSLVGSDECPISAKLVPSCGVLMGAATQMVGKQTWEQSVTAHEELVGRKMDVLHNYHLWTTVSPDAGELSRAATGQKLLITWQGKRQNGSLVKWADIAAGKENAAIDAQALKIKEFGQPMYLNFQNEPEALLGSSGTAAEYVAAWRYIHDRFIALGATNAVWTIVYMGVADSASFLANTKALYPGDAYIDYIAYDPYNRGACFNMAWKDFSGTVKPFYDWLMANGYGTKPFMLAEYGSVEDPNNPTARADWFTGATNSLLNGEFPNLKVVSYFDHPAPPATCDWRIETNPTTLASYKAFGAALKTFSTTKVSTPGAPTAVTATAANSAAVISWTAPTNTGDGAITSYKVTASPGGASVTVPGPTPITNAAIAGLTPGTNYTFKVSAINSAGTGTASAASASVTPKASTATIPAPTAGGWKLNGTAVLADGGLRLTDATTKNSNGSAFFPTPVAGASSFTVNFDSTIDGGTNADGTALVFGDAGAGAKPTSLGLAGGGLGWSGTPGFAVALDTYRNGTDPSSNFVGIATGREAATPKNLVWKATSRDTPELRTLRHIDVVASGGSIWVSVDGQQMVTTTVSLPASTLIGFSSADGNRTDRHLVSNVKISTS